MSVQHLFARGLRVTLLRYYLSINQLFIRGNPKKKFAIKGSGLDFGPLQTFLRQWTDNGRGVQMRISELFVSKNMMLRCSCRKKKG